MPEERGVGERRPDSRGSTGLSRIQHVDAVDGGYGGGHRVLKGGRGVNYTKADKRPPG